MFFYRATYSRLDISNASKELEKFCDCTTIGKWKVLWRVIKYLIETEHIGLKRNTKKIGFLCGWHK
jgi:hypothetical protein